MELYPKADLLQIDVLRMNGVQSLYVPINDIIPITKYDYWGASWKFWCKQHQCLDLDMIYAEFFKFPFGLNALKHVNVAQVTTAEKSRKLKLCETARLY